MRIGLIINPFAGAGGRMGHKGSDDLRIENPELRARVSRFLSTAPEGLYLVPRGKMGEYFVVNSGKEYRLLRSGRDDSTREDTIRAVRELRSTGVDIIVFAGGDGTARDVAEALESSEIPILGVPTGVKMHSGVFASTPEAAGILLKYFEQGRTEITRGEILDIDEDAYRRGEYIVRLYYIVNTIKFQNLLVSGKEEYSFQEDLNEIAQYFLDEFLKEDVYYVLGPGATVKSIEKMLGYYPNFLSTDLFLGRKPIKFNVNYQDLLRLTGELNPVKLVLTPIGGQGFVIGRGNQEIGPGVLTRVSRDDIVILSSRIKLSKIECLRFDTGSPDLDRKYEGVYKVIVGYDQFMAVRTCSIT
jgi:predicted polyphosphate/ATP-dependent NAD kinase